MLILSNAEALDHPCLAVLSPRERQVFLAIAVGDAPAVIAGRYELSVKTVSTYRVRVFEKVQLTSNQQCTAYAMHHGLITVSLEPAGSESETQRAA